MTWPTAGHTAQLMADLHLTRAEPPRRLRFEPSPRVLPRPHRPRGNRGATTTLHATLSCAGARISLAEQGHPAEDRPGVLMTAAADRSQAAVAASSGRSPTRSPSTLRSRPRACRCWRRPSARRGAAAASSASTPTATSSSSSSRHESRRPARARRRRRRHRAGSGHPRAKDAIEVTMHGDLRRRPAALPRLHAGVRARHDPRPRVRRHGRRGRGGCPPRPHRAARRVHEHDFGRDVRTLPRGPRPSQCLGRALFGYSGVYPRLDGGQAELVRVPSADRCLLPLDESISDEAAIFFADILPTGYASVVRGGVEVGDTVVVLGCGPVGLMAVLCAAGIAGRGDRRRRHRRKAARAGRAARSRVGRSGRAAERRRGRGDRRRLGADVVIEAAGVPHSTRASASKAAVAAPSRSSVRTSSRTTRWTTRSCSRRS